MTLGCSKVHLCLEDQPMTIDSIMEEMKGGETKK